MMGIVVVTFGTGIMGHLYSIFCSLYWVYLLMLFTTLLLIMSPSMGQLQQPLHWMFVFIFAPVIHPLNIIQNNYLHGYLPPYLPLLLQPQLHAVCFPCSGHWTWWYLQLDTVRHAAVSPSMLIIVLHFMLPRVFMRLHLNKERNCYV